MQKSSWVRKIVVGGAAALSFWCMTAQSSAQTANNRETKVFTNGRVGVYPTWQACFAERNAHAQDFDWVCRKLGYERSESATNFDCWGTNPNWSLVFSGVCSRQRGHAGQ